MDEFLDKLNTWLDKAIEYAMAMTIEQWAYVAGGFIGLLLLRWLIKRARRPKKAVVKQPVINSSQGLQLHTFQIAPLGRDAFLKIQNTLEPITLTKLEIPDRQNIRVKNAIAGHKLDKSKIYSILLEAVGNTKLDDGFTVKLTYLTAAGKVGTAQFIAFQTKKD
ncbi:MAG: hypothetical protein DWQ02_06865 [Bacteroidetes bacterium]|nr:MAG: hypothetical protein DWQ02_06865 [Bacteroidota bacterium]